MTLTDLFSKVAVRDAVTAAALGVLSWNAWLTYNTIRSTAHRHHDDHDHRGLMDGHSIRSEISSPNSDFGFTRDTVDDD